MADYDARRGCGISVVDPGAEPGGSTISGLPFVRLLAG